MEILFEEFRQLKPALNFLSIGFHVFRAKTPARVENLQKPPYFACRYNRGNLGNVNVVAFCYPLLADWKLMEADANRYRRRIQSSLREEMIHAIQVLTVKQRYERSTELKNSFDDAESYYNSILARVVDELARSKAGQKAVLTAAKLYYEDWTITSMEKLRQTDCQYHGRESYLAIELIRQIAQIRFGELMSEEAKGGAWDRHRIFSVGEYGTTENLMLGMAAALRQAVPELIDLSPTLTAALGEIEAKIQTIADMQKEWSIVPGSRDSSKVR